MAAKSLVSGVLAVALLVGGYLLVRSLEDHPVFPLASQCTVTGQQTVRLDAEQTANAATIAAVGLRRDVPLRGVTVALATALQESKLRNLAHGDRDSLGLFQQRPSQGWGDPDELNDPRYASAAFFDRLLRVPGWRAMRITEAAQTVQRSAHPEAYQKWAEEAETLARAFDGKAPTRLSCRLRDETTSSANGTGALRQALRRDWGEVVVREPRRPDRLALAVDTERYGWRLAHWLVAHAAQHGVRHVRYAGKEWVAHDGGWRKAGGGRSTVTARFDERAKSR